MTGLGILTPIIDLMFPPRCPLCGDPLAQQGGLCVECWGKLVIPGEPACTLCQRPLGASPHDEAFGKDGADGGMVCAPCLAKPPRHDGIAAATLYNDASRDLVLAFKHGRRTALSKLLARLIVPRLGVLEGEWLMVPVPLHRWRLWNRGFNQAALLAGEIAAMTGQVALPDALYRRKATRPLGGLNRRQRAEALSGAIIAHPARASTLRGAQVVLVDDVMTSGATTESCLRALRQAGASRIRIACFARVLDEALDHAGPTKETPGV